MGDGEARGLDELGRERGGGLAGVGGGRGDDCLLDVGTGEVDVLGIEVVADVATAVSGRGDERGPRAHERVEDEVVLECVEEDQPLGERDREWRGMAHPLRALGWEVPHVEGRSHELVGIDRGLRREARDLTLAHRLRTVEASLARDHDALRDVAQHRVRRLAEGSPGAAPRRADVADSLAPHDLAAEQQTEIVLQDPDDVGREAAIGLAPQVRDVHRDAPTRFQCSLAVGEHIREQLEVLDVRARDAVALELLLVLLAGEVGR